MEQYFSSMVDAHVRYSEDFIALLEVYSTLGEHIVSLGEAKQSYKDASTAALAHFNAAGGPRTDDSTIQNLNTQHERFILECENLRAFIDSSFEHITSLKNAQPRDLLVQLSQGQGDEESDTAQEDNSHLRGFKALLEEYNIIGEQMSNLGDAIESYKNVSTAIMAQMTAAGGHSINDLAIQNLNAQHECFALEYESFRAFIDSRSQHISELAVALPNNAKEAAPVVSTDNTQPTDCLELSSQGKGDMESDARLGDDEANVSEEQKMALSHALSDLGVNSPEPDMAATRLQEHMEPYLNSIVDTLEMYAETFITMVHQYSSRTGHLLHEIVPPVRAAHKRYILALTVMQSAFLAFCYTDIASVFIAEFMKDIISGIDALQANLLLECTYFITSGFGSWRYKSEDPARVIKEYLVSLEGANETLREAVTILLEHYCEITDHHVDSTIIKSIKVQHERLSMEGGKLIDSINKRRQMEKYLEWFNKQHYPLPPPVPLPIEVGQEKEKGEKGTSVIPNNASGDMESDTRRTELEETVENDTEGKEENRT